MAKSLQSYPGLDFKTPAKFLLKQSEQNLPIKTNQINSNLHIRHWAGKTGYPVIAYLHGIQGHSQWFEHTAQSLSKQGFNIYALDRRGAGANREEQGLRGHIDSFLEPISDLDNFLNQIIQNNSSNNSSEKHSNSDLYLMSNCWSSRLVYTYLLCKKVQLKKPSLTSLKGLIFTTPSCKFQIDLKFATKLEVMEAFFNNRKLLFDIPIEDEMFTKYEPSLNFIKNDPLKLKQVTAAFYFYGFFYQKIQDFYSPWESLPTLVIQPEIEEIVYPQSVISWFNKLKSKDKTLFLHKASSHCLDLDNVPSEQNDLYINTIGNWLRRKNENKKES